MMTRESLIEKLREHYKPGDTFRVTEFVDQAYGTSGRERTRTINYISRLAWTGKVIEQTGERGIYKICSWSHNSQSKIETKKMIKSVSLAISEPLEHRGEKVIKLVSDVDSELEKLFGVKYHYLFEWLHDTSEVGQTVTQRMISIVKHAHDCSLPIDWEKYEEKLKEFRRKKNEEAS